MIMKVSTHFMDIVMKWIIGLMLKENTLYGMKHRMKDGELDNCLILGLILVSLPVTNIFWG